MGSVPFDAHTSKEALQGLAFESLTSYETWVQQEFKLLPTDPRFLDLHPWQCEMLYWQRVFWHRSVERVRENLPVRSMDDLLADESFEAKLAEMDRRLEQEAAAKAAATPPTPLSAPERTLVPTEIVSRWRSATTR